MTTSTTASRWTLLGLAVLLILLPQAVRAQEVELRPDRIRVYDRQTMEELHADDVRTVAVGFDTVTVEAGATLKELLEARGILPDADAYLLVYQMNETIDDADRIAAGSRIVLPTAVVLEGRLNAGDVLLDVDVFRAEQLAALAYAVADTMVMPAWESDAIAAAAGRLFDAMGRLSAGSFEGSAVSPVALALVEENARLAEDVVEELWSGNEAAVEGADDLVAEIDAVLECRRNNLHCEVPVHVRPVRAESGEHLAGIQVYAAPRGKFKTIAGCRTSFQCGRAFPRLSPEARLGLVPNVIYVVWARSDADSLVAGPKEFEPTFEGPNDLDLSVVLGDE